jgi:hypothetical protein
LVWTRFVPFSWVGAIRLGLCPGGALLVCSQLGQEGGSGHDQRDVPMPTMPGAGLTMLKPEIVLGAQETVLNRPAPACRLGHVGEQSSLARMDKIIGQIVRAFQAAAEQQPALEAVLRRAVQGQARPVIEM